VIAHFDRAPECGCIIEPDPTRAEVIRLCNRPAMEDRPRVANRQDIVVPVLSELLDTRDHLLGRECRTRGKFPGFLLPGSEDFHGVPADVNNQHVHGTTFRRLLSAWPAGSFLSAEAANAD